MASGRKNYFRHSFFARNDMKLRLLRDSVGIGFYFYYFSLLELCGEASGDELKDDFEFHNSQIRSLWSVNLKKSERVACVMHSVGLLEFEKRAKSFWFSIPNFAKYLGRYTIKLDSNGPNKRKGKEIKEKKRKEENIAPSLVFECWNNICGAKLKKIKNLSDARKTTIRVTANNLDGFDKIEAWEKYFQKIKTTPFLCGLNNRGWIADFDFVIKQASAIKITEGKYDDNEQLDPDRYAKPKERWEL